MGAYPSPAHAPPKSGQLFPTIQAFTPCLPSVWYKQPDRRLARKGAILSRFVCNRANGSRSGVSAQETTRAARTMALLSSCGLLSEPVRMARATTQNQLAKAFVRQLHTGARTRRMWMEALKRRVCMGARERRACIKPLVRGDRMRARSFDSMRARLRRARTAIRLLRAVCGMRCWGSSERCDGHEVRGRAGACMEARERLRIYSTDGCAP